MEELRKKVEDILVKFTGQEVGNRLSEFAMLALKEIISNMIKNHKVNEKKPEANALRPVIKEVAKEAKK